MHMGLGLGLTRRAPVAGGGGASYLDSVVASVCCDLDGAFYTSGQTWENQIESPADGAAQTDYDFYLGADGSASTDDPTFDTDKFTFDGGDHFQIVSGNTPLLDDWHHNASGSDWWIAMAFQLNSVTGQQFLFATNYGAVAADGAHIRANGTDVRLVLNDDGTIDNQVIESAALSTGTDYLLIVSADKSTGSVRSWLNTTTASSHTYTFQTAGSASHAAARIGKDTNNTNPIANGGIAYHFSAGNEYLDNTKAAAIFAHLEARHGRDYTP